jgi:hypothetical protein
LKDARKAAIRRIALLAAAFSIKSLTDSKKLI